MTIAVDFDGTIVEHRYPQIGKELPFAVSTLRQLQKEQPELRLILWTVREGELLRQAVEWCRQRGLEFFAVNSNYPEELPVTSDYSCRKVTADLYIDDRNLGTLPSWPEIYRRLSGNVFHDADSSQSRSSLFARLFGRKKASVKIAKK